MHDIFSEKWYSLKDLNRAFNMGLESAVFVLENAEGLTSKGIRDLTESLKKMVADGPVPEHPGPCKGPGQLGRINPECPADH